MSRLTLSAEFSDALREIRIQNKIASKDVAAALGRSPSYVSKIENGTIKSISEEELDIILKILFPKASTEQERLEKLVESQVGKHEFSLRDSWVWFQNFDTVYRLIPIPTSLIADINDILRKEAITIDRLVERINKNEELCEEDLNNQELPYNLWFERYASDSRMSIKMHLTKEEVENILNGNTEVCNFVTMQAIVHYLFKIKSFPSNHSFTDDEIQSLSKEWQDLLDRHKFFTLSRKEMLLSQTRSKNQAESILNEFDKENQEIVNKLLRFIKTATDMDVLNTNKALKQFISNLEWDYNFMFFLIGSAFASIEECSFTNKLQLLKDIRELIAKYREMPEEQKSLDSYSALD